MLLGASEVQLIFECDNDDYGSFARVYPEQLRRALSNLTRNAIEAIESGGRVTWRLQCCGGTIRLQLQDTGCGMDESVLGRALEGGFSFGKRDGNGIGLCAAKETILSLDGTFEIESEPGRGTVVSIVLEMVPPPEWCSTKLNLYGRRTCVVVDDDPSVHTIWEQKLADWLARDARRGLVHFCNSEDFAVPQDAVDGAILFLVDFRLGSESLNGLELIKEHGVQRNAYMVTTDFAEPELQEACKAMGVRLIAKGAIQSIPLLY